jgi:hypothetical protein
LPAFLLFIYNNSPHNTILDNHEVRWDIGGHISPCISSLYVPNQKRGTAFGKYVHSPYERRMVACSRPPVTIGQIGPVT